ALTSGGNPLTIEGLWALTPGNGGAAGSPNSIYFSSGPDDESHGLFGVLSAPEPGAGARLGFGLAGLRAPRRRRGPRRPPPARRPSRRRTAVRKSWTASSRVLRLLLTRIAMASDSGSSTRAISAPWGSCSPSAAFTYRLPKRRSSATSGSTAGSLAK